MTKQDTIQHIKTAILRGDTFYKKVALPSPQKCGTYFQQVSYAQIAAQDIYEAWFNTRKELPLEPSEH